MSTFTIRASVVLAALLTAGIGVRAAIDQRGQTPSTGRGAATGAAASAPSKDWKMADLLPGIIDLGIGHDFERGRQVFKKASCGTCHAFASESEGAGLAPDLTPVASKYTRDFILQSILEPSATINGQFFHTKFTLKNGSVVTGSIIDVVDKKIIVAPVMLAPQATVELAEADVKSEEPSPVSPMPAGLLNQFTKDEIVELFAFLDSGGDRNAAVYKKKSPVEDGAPRAIKK